MGHNKSFYREFQNNLSHSDIEQIETESMYGKTKESLQIYFYRRVDDVKAG